MRIQPKDLELHLKRKLISPSPVYFVFGDESFQQMEAVATLRAAARNQGYTDIERLELLSPKDEGDLWIVVNTPSLFSEKRLIECRLKEGKITKHIQETLLKVVHQASRTPNIILLILWPEKIESALLKSDWFLAMERMAITLFSSTLPKYKYTEWLSERASKLNLSLTKEALHYLCECTEGNLMAGAQALEKIALIDPRINPQSPSNAPNNSPQSNLRHLSNDPPSHPLDVNDIKPILTLEARYSVFDLVDTLFQGDYKRTFRILNSLKTEGIEATKICWAITREVRGLLPLINIYTTGLPLNDSSSVSTSGIWKYRRNLATAFLKRHTESSLYDILSLSQKIDILIKTDSAAKAWQSLNDLCFLCCTGENNDG